jgi:hypothetical protein
MALPIKEQTMRKRLVLLTPLLVAGCVNQSASYYIGNDHTLTLRAQQERFWSKQVTLRLVAARLPECQRLLVLGTVPLSELDVELYAAGDNVYTLRAGNQVWQVETQGCTALPAPPQALGQPLGAFRLDAAGNKLVFEKAVAAARQ